MSHDALPAEPDISWNLIPLAPKYQKAEHGGYVAAIQNALTNPQILNIALSGNYGIGKSSILREVARRQGSRVVELSLSTLTLIEASELDDSVPIQALTPTNRIQHEIVKQLLYREDPRKTSGSRFRRIERFRWRREMAVAATFGIITAVIFLLTGWTAQLAASFTALKQFGEWVHLIVWAAAAITILLMLWLFYGRLRIKEVSAGSATVTLEENAVSYFDQYLDEIVYFFEVSNHDIVVFEDIDRFNDSHIFETLRALNTLLNSSPQINRPIRFIYAIKDSIFDRTGLQDEGRKVEPDATGDPAQAEVMRANRTKFFDLVIPVVPFITHRSARNLAGQLLNEIEHDVESSLLDSAIKYVPDMRLLKNVRNEFVVFRDRILSGDGEKLNLSQTDLFAMMLYKSTHLSDFERIRLGTSRLDAVYQISRDIVAENIKNLEEERLSLLLRQSEIEGVRSKSLLLGERLLAHAQRTAQAAGLRQDGALFQFEGQNRSREDIKGKEFWQRLSLAGGDSILKWRNNQGQSLSFSRSHLVAELDDDLDAKRWDEDYSRELRLKLYELGDKISFLRSTDMDGLIARPEFKIASGPRKLNWSEAQEDSSEETLHSLDSYAKILLSSGLAYHLVKAGYINRNFTLYTSTFHGNRVSSAAMNFIIHHVERDRMDEHFELDHDDVDAILREKGKDALKEPALYNIAILDRLLVVNIDAADIMIRSISGRGERQDRFLQAYLTAGEQRNRFIARYVTFSRDVFDYLVNQAVLDASTRRELVDIALGHLPSRDEFDNVKLSGATVRYLETHYDSFSSLTASRSPEEQVYAIVKLFADGGVIVPSLEPLDSQTRQLFATHSLYKMTYENLVLAVRGGGNVALDVIYIEHHSVYRYVLANLRAYLKATDGRSATVDRGSLFVAVIEDVLGARADCLREVVGRADPACQVEDLTAVSEGAWPALAENRRFPATFANVSAYVSVQGAIDYRLACLLKTEGRILEMEGVGEESKNDLALAILSAGDLLPSANLRARLVESLVLSEPLDVESIASEAGELFSLLLELHLIEDTERSYKYLASTDWSTRKSFIRVSTEFVNFMTPEVLGPELGVLLADGEIDMDVKRAVLARSEAFAASADHSGLSELARFAAQQKAKVPMKVLDAMAHANVASEDVLPLIEPHLGDIELAQLSVLLQALGGDYANLTSVGYEKPKIPNSRSDRALLERLKSEGIVSSYDKGRVHIVVNKRRK